MRPRDARRAGALRTSSLSIDVLIAMVHDSYGHGRSGATPSGATPPRSPTSLRWRGDRHGQLGRACPSPPDMSTPMARAFAVRTTGLASRRNESPRTGFASAKGWPLTWPGTRRPTPCRCARTRIDGRRRGGSRPPPGRHRRRSAQAASRGSPPHSPWATAGRGAVLPSR